MNAQGSRRCRARAESLHPNGDRGASRKKKRKSFVNQNQIPFNSNNEPPEGISVSSSIEFYSGMLFSLLSMQLLLPTTTTTTGMTKCCLAHVDKARLQFRDRDKANNLMKTSAMFL